MSKYILPPTFSAEFGRADNKTCRLVTSQVLPLSPEEAFAFFEDPGNLFDITPDWLDFSMIDPKGKKEVFEGAEFDYTIRWFSMKLRWRSRIVDYRPPDRFTDIQIAGPYALWRHLHTFEKVTGGTLMRDVVYYRPPFGFLGTILHGIIIRRQLLDIFSYRAVRIFQWAEEKFEEEAP
jgi:ligand-binding SRPBCC domain-containing protein